METKEIVKGMLLGAVLFWVMLPCFGHAIPQKINYQGYLTTREGIPINETLLMTFSLYDVPTLGIPLWTEDQNVTVINGIYNVSLGNADPISLAFDVPYYLGIRVGSDPEMTPRKALASVGYAFRARAADNADYSLISGTATSANTANSATTATNFSGVLAGDVTGTQNATTVARIQNYPVSSTAPSANQVLRHNGSNWTPSAVNLGTDTAGILPISRGGTGSSMQNFVDLSNPQTVGGTKTFSSPIGSNVATGTAPLQVNSTTMVTNLNAEMVGGQRLSDLDTLYQRKHWKVAVVEPYGNGDYTNPVTGMADSSNWCGTATVIAPCLLKIMPGFYDVGVSSVQMKEYIDIEGSGENVTILSGTIDTGFSGVVNGASHAEIRFLTVENRGGTGHSNSIALSTYPNPGQVSPKITNLTLRASGGNYNYGVYNYNYGSFYVNIPAIMSNLTITASGGTDAYGIYNDSSLPIMTNLNVLVNETNNGYAIYNRYSNSIMNSVRVKGYGNTYGYGIFNTNSDPEMTDVTVADTDGQYCYGIYNSVSYPRIKDTRIRAGAQTLAYGIYNESSSPIMTNIDVVAFSGSAAYGIVNSQSPSSASPSMTNATVNVNAGDAGYGIYNYSSSPGITNATVKASGFSLSYGIFNDSSSPEITNVTVKAWSEMFGSQYNYGIYNHGSSQAYLKNVTSNATDGIDSFGILNTSTGGNITIDHCRLSGKRSVRNDNSSATIFIGSSKLNGDVLGTPGTIRCVGVYDGSYSAISCP